MSNKKDLERWFENLDDEDDGDSGFFPQSEYTPEDFRTGNFDPDELFTPYTREQAEETVEWLDLDVSPEKIRQASLERAIDRLENPEDHPAPGQAELTSEEKEVLRERFDVEPATALSPETRGEHDGK